MVGNSDSYTYSYLNCPPFMVVSGIANTTSTSIGMEGEGGGSHGVADKGYVNIQNS